MFERVRDRLVWLLREFAIAARDVIKLPFWLIGLGFRRLGEMGFRRLAILAAAAVILTIVAAGTLIKATSQPGFCKSCHVMVPYFEAWQTSSHSNIQCVTCHVPPGLEGTIHHKFQALSMVANYFTGLYKRSKPWAEVEDNACLREGCHDTRLLKSVEDFQGVVFDHEPHLANPRRDRQLRCTSCHAQIVQGEHITVTSTTCFLCHFKPEPAGDRPELGRCTHCHQPPTGAAAADSSFDHALVLLRDISCLNCHADAVSGDGFVPRDRCNSCHGQVEHIERYEDGEFVHRMHVTEHKVECLQCHTAIRHGDEARPEHPDADCAECHAAQSAVWRGELPGLPAKPSLMARVGMHCNSCHTGPLHDKTAKKQQPACTPCHEGGYDDLWPQWAAPLERTVDALMADARALPEPKRSQMLAALETYRRGGPLHDPDLVHTLNEAIHGQPGQHGESCSGCHPAAVQSNPIWRGRSVPHATHAKAGLTCDRCHETDTAQQHGTLKLAENACNTCHHQPALVQGKACGSCHTFQQQVYTGALNSPGAEPSMMATAEVGCTDCHTSVARNIRRTDADACVTCHEPAYADSLTAWQQHGHTLAADVAAQMHLLNPQSAAYRSFEELAAALRRDGSRGAHNPALFTQWKQRIETQR